jgi:hypothetical protein
MGNLSREEAFAISAMEGVPITHRYFNAEEYIELLSNGNIRTEEGYQVSVEEFNKYRQGEDWDIDWSRF